MKVFITLDTSFIDSKIQKYESLSTPVFNVLNNGSIETVTSQIINKLCNYAEIGSM